MEKFPASGYRTLQPIDKVVQAVWMPKLERVKRYSRQNLPRALSGTADGDPPRAMDGCGPDLSAMRELLLRYLRWQGEEKIFFKWIMIRRNYGTARMKMFLSS